MAQRQLMTHDFLADRWKLQAHRGDGGTAGLSIVVKRMRAGRSMKKSRDQLEGDGRGDVATGSFAPASRVS
jgi:hypothetical protein